MKMSLQMETGSKLSETAIALTSMLVGETPEQIKSKMTLDEPMKEGLTLGKLGSLQLSAKVVEGSFDYEYTFESTRDFDEIYSELLLQSMPVLMQAFAGLKAPVKKFVAGAKALRSAENPHANQAAELARTMHPHVDMSLADAGEERLGLDTVAECMGTKIKGAKGLVLLRLDNGHSFIGGCDSDGTLLYGLVADNGQWHDVKDKSVAGIMPECDNDEHVGEHLLAMGKWLDLWNTETEVGKVEGAAQYPVAESLFVRINSDAHWLSDVPVNIIPANGTVDQKVVGNLQALSGETMDAEGHMYMLNFQHENLRESMVVYASTRPRRRFAIWHKGGDVYGISLNDEQIKMLFTANKFSDKWPATDLSTFKHHIQHHQFNIDEVALVANAILELSKPTDLISEIDGDPIVTIWGRLTGDWELDKMVTHDMFGREDLRALLMVRLDGLTDNNISLVQFKDTKAIVFMRDNAIDLICYADGSTFEYYATPSVISKIEENPELVLHPEAASEVSSLLNWARNNL